MTTLAQKITWIEPEQDTVISVEISKSSSKYGSYTVIDTVSATSDGQPKSSSNSWVVIYTDINGTITDWYKIRFYDSVLGLYSDYSDPITTQQLLQLCTIDDVKREIDTVGRWTDDEIFKTIVEVDDYIYMEQGTPLQATVSQIGKIDQDVQRRYYVGEENVYRFDRVFYGTTTMYEIYLEDEYKQNRKNGMIEFFSTTNGGPDINTSQEVEVHYVPRLYHRLSLWMTIVRLLKRTDMMKSGESSKEMNTAVQNLEDVERLISHRHGVQLSSDVQNYDFVYGVNRKKVTQNFKRNRYIGSTGWSS